jgi:hypothetical protein
MELEKELVESIKKWSEKGETAASSNAELLFVGMGASLMMICGLLRQIGTEFEKLNNTFTALNEFIDFVEKK